LLGIPAVESLLLVEPPVLAAQPANVVTAKASAQSLIESVILLSFLFSLIADYTASLGALEYHFAQRYRAAAADCTRPRITHVGR